MPVSGKEASEIGQRYGLSIEQSAALKTLADSTEEAEELAKIYGQEAGEAELQRAVEGMFGSTS